MRSNNQPALLVIDTAYTLENMRQLGNEQSVLCRDLDGFFRHVWSVHPLASLLTSEAWAPRYGPADCHEMSERHTFIEGKIGRFRFLHRIAPLNFLLSQVLLALALVRLVRREGIRFVRGGDPLYQGLFAWTVARLAGVPLVIRVNGNNNKIRENTGKAIYPSLFRSRALEERIERFVFTRADLVVAPNQDNVDYAIANGADPAHVAIFGYGNLLATEHLSDPRERGCDTALFDKLGVKPRSYLLCIGRLMAVKFPEDAIHVLAALGARGHDVSLVFAGEGSERDSLAALATTLGVGDRTIFAGNQNQKELAQLNPHAAVVISPLTGRALSEAALGGAAIVAYDLDWQGDLIRTDETGILVPFRDVEALTDAAERLLVDHAYAVAMRQGARARALTMLDPSALNENERAEYSRLLARFT